MKLPDDDVLFVCEEWLKKADTDFIAAVAFLKLKKPRLYETLCFHLQQAAEKYIKAYLVYYQIEYPKTHSIKILIDLVGTVDGELMKEIKAARTLTKYGVAVRYPGEPILIDLSDAYAAFGIVQNIRKKIIKKLEIRKRKTI